MDGELDSTRALTEGGTQAASPHAIAQHVAAGSAQGSAAPIGQSASALADAAPRIHMFHLFGTIAPLVAIGVFAVLGGDALALHATYAGCVVLAACNAVLVWMTARPGAYRARFAASCGSCRSRARNRSCGSSARSPARS